MLPQVYIDEVWEQGYPDESLTGLYTKGFMVVYRQLTFFSDGTYVSRDTTRQGFSQQTVQGGGTWRRDPASGEPMIEREGEYVALPDLPVFFDPVQVTLGTDPDALNPPQVYTLRRVYKAGQVDVSPIVAQVNSLLEQFQRDHCTVGPALFDEGGSASLALIEAKAKRAVALSQWLVSWSSRRSMADEKQLSYKVLLAKSMVYAGDEAGALEMLEPLQADDRSNLDLSHTVGLANLWLYEKQGMPLHYQAAMNRFAEPIKYYNLRNEKPDTYWRAWLSVLQLLEAAEGELADSIPNRVRMLMGVDKYLGGQPFRANFERIIQRQAEPDRVLP